jgi:hypothetical protein
MSVEEKEWRQLCRLVADEPDPQRLSKLVDQLIKVLDARKKELEKSGQEATPAD